MHSPTELWRRFQQHLCVCPALGISLDISRIDFPDGFFAGKESAMAGAYAAMKKLEAGDKVNPDEKDDAGQQGRMVGHYWLRAPQLAPKAKLREAITSTLKAVKKFVADVHKGKIKPPKSSGAPRFTEVLVVGIGGSALGPQLVADALTNLDGPDKMTVHFLDNTDPDGIDRTLNALKKELKRTLVLVISKSGGTPETRNGMLEVEAAFTKHKLKFNKHAVAVTGENSKLDKVAKDGAWLARFPMWDWVGGRTSVMSAVGLLPAALQGIDIDSFLAGAAAMDELTRKADTKHNPAAILALMWHHETGGRGLKDMVMLPYKDRLLLLSRYLQQLIMESLGKRKNFNNTKDVHQGIAVYGNKGSTDQHAYVQQLRDGVNNFFATFIVSHTDGGKASKGKSIEVEPGITSGDFLNGFWQGTRTALYESGRGSITIFIDAMNTKTLGALIALYERAVGFYATLVDINAYHQPGVEAGKKAAGVVLDLQGKIVSQLSSGAAGTADEIAHLIDAPDQAETVHHILQHLSANHRGVVNENGRYHAK